MIKVPKSLKKYFWDIEFSELSLDKDSFFIIKRVIDRGKTKDVIWLIQQYDINKIRKVVTTSRDLSKKTAVFWSRMLNIDPQNVACLKKPYSPIHFGLSS